MIETLFQDLALVAEQLSAAEIPWGVFAGAAACAYGSPRPIKDIDILIPSDTGNRVAELFPQAQLVLDQDGRVAMMKIAQIEIIAGLTKNICLEMDSEMSTRLVTDHILGVEVSLICLEDNLVFKAVLGRGPDVGKHDWADISDMLACAEEINWEYVDWRLQRCAPERAAEILIRLNNMYSHEG